MMMMVRGAEVLLRRVEFRLSGTRVPDARRVALAWGNDYSLKIVR